MYRKSQHLLIMLLLLSLLSYSTAQAVEIIPCVGGERAKPVRSTMVFPGKTWACCSPEQQGIDSPSLTKIEALMKKARANGVLIRNGYIVAEWTFSGPPEKKLKVQSITKAITSLVLGLAVDQKRIGSLDDYVKDYYPELDVGPYTDRITFRHLATMTSGIYPGWSNYQKRYVVVPPGTEHHYHNDQYTVLAKALTHVFKRELKDVLAEQVLNIIGAHTEWGYDGSVQTAQGQTIRANAGYAFTQWTARDLARVGHLYLNNGRWKNRQVLSQAYVKETFTAVGLKVNEYSKRHAKETDTEKIAQRAQILSQCRYGLGWWTTDVDKGGWYMSGNGGQFCLVIPEFNLVMTKVNDYNIRPSIGLDRFFPLIVNAIQNIQ